jgi:Domain of Unknown Function (DUF1206)
MPSTKALRPKVSSSGSAIRWLASCTPGSPPRRPAYCWAREPTEGDQTAQDLTARLLSQPFGPWLVAVAGLIVLAVGVAHIRVGVRESFARHLRLGDLAAQHRRWVVTVGRIGYIAHGLALGIIAAFLIVAAVQSRPDQARGLGGALAVLVEQPFGPWLLTLLGLGLAAYGAIMLIEARYRRIDVT